MFDGEILLLLQLPIQHTIRAAPVSVLRRVVPPDAESFDGKGSRIITLAGFRERLEVAVFVCLAGEEGAVAGCCSLVVGKRAEPPPPLRLPFRWWCLLFGVGFAVDGSVVDGKGKGAPWPRLPPR